MTIIVLLAALRVALPYIVRAYVNRQLGHIPEYSGHVEKIRMNLYRGAYTIINLRLYKTNNNVREPFVALPLMDLSMEWKELIHGSFVGQVEVERPRINVVNGPTPQQQQTGQRKEDLQHTLESLFPFKLNRFQVNAGEVHFRDLHSDPQVSLYVTNLFATATNLSNTRDLLERLPAGVVARGRTIGHGDVTLELHMNPLADSPTFKLVAGITNMDLRALNNFMRAYGHFDVERGTFALFVDVAAAHNRYQGYLKPFFFHLQVFDWKKERGKNILHIFWEAIVQGVSEVLRNQRYDQLATTIPISGTMAKGSNVPVWTTIGGILRNAFVRALLPQVTRSVPLPGSAHSRAPPE